MPYRYASVTVDGSFDRDAVGACLRDWFITCAENLTGAWWQDVQACQPLPSALGEFHSLTGRDGPAHVEVVPGAAVAYVSIMQPFTKDMSAWTEAVCTAESWEVFLERLGELPSTAAMEFVQYGPDGAQVPRSAPSITATFSDPYRRWLTLTLMIPGDHIVGSPQMQRAVREQLRAFCGRWPVTYAEVSASAGPQATAFEQLYPYRPPTASYPSWAGPSLSELARHDIERSRTWLRGYSWVTAFAPELADRFGGTQQLREQGAFVDVQQLDNGVCWLVATERYEDYGWPEAERVFEALAPGLPAGIPHPPDRADPEPFIVRRDASDLHPGAT
ncbi:hypothetical protein ACFQ29_25875 [Longispora fulva]